MRSPVLLLFPLLIGSILAGSNNYDGNNDRQGGPPPSGPPPCDWMALPGETTTATTCDACGSTSTYAERIISEGSISDNARVITATGCPHHYNVCTGKDEVNGCGGVGEEGTISEATVQDFKYTIPAYPVFRPNYLNDEDGNLRCYMCEIGVALNGVAIFSGNVRPYDELLGTCEMLDVHDNTSEWISFDMCGGHANKDGVYHYHTPPSCLIADAEARSSTGTGHSAQIGWALDGFPVYGPLYTGGVDASTVTDDCGGKEEVLPDVDNFMYRYYMTGPTSDLYSLPHVTPSDDQFPYAFDCYAGYTYDEQRSGSTGKPGYTSDYTPEAVEGYTGTTPFSSYGNFSSSDQKYTSSYVSFNDDGKCTVPAA